MVAREGGANRRMIDTTRTTTVLLEGLHDPGNQAAWSEFDARYRPILTAFARRLGLSDDDAADAAQETLLQFLKEYREGRYDRERGRLRSWLLGIARTRVAGQHRARSQRREARGESAIVNLEDDATISRIWESERRRVILREALTELRVATRTSDRTIRAFELHVLQQMPVAAVALELSITDHDVYQAKSRVASRLRDIVDRLDQVFDEDVE
jgi:RNA polymerase sigma factor (sigma-70 family)